MIGYDSIFASDISPSARAVYLYLKYRTNRDNECWPSHSTIAKQTGYSNSTVKRSISELEKYDFLMKEHRRRKNGGKSSNRYILK